MNVVSRGVRNAFRNITRTLSIVVILGLSVGLSLAMLVAHQTVGQKIDSVKSSAGNTVSISPAGVRGFEGGGNALTGAQLAKLNKVAHVTKLSESLDDRLTTDNTNLQSAVEAGALGQRFFRNGGISVMGSGPATTNSSDSGAPTLSFTPPVTVSGTTDPTNLSASRGGGDFKLKSGKVFSSTSSDNVALVGTTLASKNNLKVGSTFTAYGATVKVIGIFDAGNTFANNQVIMPLKTVQTLSSQTDSVTNATIYVDSVTNIDSVTSAVKNSLGSAADVTNSAETVKQTIEPLQNIQTISLYSLIGAAIAGSIILLLTMVMIVRERRREIGVIKAIGASNLKVMYQFMTEAVTLTGLGAIIGIVLGAVAASPITNMLVTNSSNAASNFPKAGLSVGSAGGPGPVRVFTRGGPTHALSNIHAIVGWNIILYGLIVALVIALVGSAIASLTIAKIRPAEVMRAE